MNGEKGHREPAGAPAAISLRGAADRLREFGYDIGPPRPGDPPDGSIVARRDLGERSVLVAVDAGGRIRAEITWRVGEWPSREAIGGVAARVVDSVTRTINASGTVAGPEQIASFVDGLRTIVPWATNAADREPASGGSPHREGPP